MMWRKSPPKTKEQYTERMERKRRGKMLDGGKNCSILMYMKKGIT
jgi:hypothetical protein